MDFTHLRQDERMLLETTIVTADGDLKVANGKLGNDYQDLFWACQGGGGGNFGINVGFKLQTYLVPKVSVYKITWSPEDGAAAFYEMQQVALTAPDSFSMELRLLVSDIGPLVGARDISVQVIGQNFGPVAELTEILDPAIQAVTPTSYTIEEMSLADGTSFLAESGCNNAFYTKSVYLSEPLPPNALRVLMEFFTKRYPIRSRVGAFKIFSWGGAISNKLPHETAFVHRTEEFLIESCTSWHHGDEPAIIAESKQWLRDLFHELRPYFTDSAYQNFIDPDLKGWQSAYYGKNFRRLVDVKTKYDPDNYFNFPLSIPVRG